MTGTVIRPAAINDVEDIARIHRDSSAYSLASFIPETELAKRTIDYRVRQWNDILNNLKPNDPQPAVAEVDGKVAGIVRCYLDPGVAHLGHVHNLFVDPPLLRRGIGTLLLAFATEQLALAGATTAQLITYEQNPEATSFYERNGWQLTGAKLVEPIDETDLESTVVVMEKPL